MEFFLILLIAAASIAVIAISLRSMAIAGASKRWWIGCVLTLIAGILAGVFFAGFDYSPTPDLRIVGFPFPKLVFQWDGGDWEGYVGSLTTIADLLNCTACSVCLLQLFALIAIFRFGWWPHRPTEQSGFPVSHPTSTSVAGASLPK